MKLCRQCAVAVVVALTLWCTWPSSGLIEALMPFSNIVDQSHVIMVGHTTALNPTNKTFTVAVDKVLKGSNTFEIVQGNLAGGQYWHPDAAWRHVKVGQTVVVFYARDGGRIVSLAHLDGFFIQFYSESGKPAKETWWNFTHIELRLRRTFDGTTEELIKLLTDGLAGKVKWPEPNPKMPDLTRSELAGQVRPHASRLDPAKRLFAKTIPLTNGGGEGRSVSWADYDGDGQWDALVCTAERARLFHNEGTNGFRDVTDTVGLKGGARSAVWADYDGDGRPDLYLVPNRQRPTLWRNRPGRFEDQSALLPDLGQWNGEGVAWLDADGDGRPDILLTNGEFGNFLLRNPGRADAPFVDVSTAWGLGPRGFGVANGEYLALTDWDSDGWPDFLYNLDRGILAHNDGGRQFSLAKRSRVEFAATGDPKIGAAFGDFNNDGYPDLFVPQRRDPVRRYRGHGDGTFTDVTAGSGDLALLDGARSAVSADFNGDGWPDLLVGMIGEPLRLYLNTGQGTFTDYTLEAGLGDARETLDATGLAVADANGDGRLDVLFVTDSGAAGILLGGGAPLKYPALRVRLPARAAPGAIVRVRDARDTNAGLRVVSLVNNYSSQEPPEVVFHLPPGNYTVSVLFTDATVRQSVVRLTANGLLWEP